MANDWLAVLMSGLGGAFTGAGVAQDRRRQQAMQDAALARQAKMDEAQAFTTQLQQRGALDELGFRPAAEFEQSVTRLPVLPGSGALGQAASAGFAQAQRGETIETPVGRFTQNRAETPRALQMRDVAMRREDARAELERRATERRQDADQRLREIREQNTGRIAVVNARDAGPGAGEGGDVNLMQIPPAQRGAVINNRTKLGVIDQAAAALQAYPEAVGLGRGLTPGMLRDRARVGGIPNPFGDPKGVGARALLGNLASLEIRDRSGAAVTASEFPRLKPFIPVLTGPDADDYETVMWKLQQFKKVIAEENLAIGDAFGVDLTPYTQSTGTQQRRAGQSGGQASGQAGGQAPMTGQEMVLNALRGGRP